MEVLWTPATTTLLPANAPTPHHLLSAGVFRSVIHVVATAIIALALESLIFAVLQTRNARSVSVRPMTLIVVDFRVFYGYWCCYFVAHVS